MNVSLGYDIQNDHENQQYEAALKGLEWRTVAEQAAALLKNALAAGSPEAAFLLKELRQTAQCIRLPEFIKYIDAPRPQSRASGG